MEEKYAKACTYALLVTILAASAVAIATNNSFVLAQPCQVVLGSPNVSAEPFYYYGGNFEVTLPVSASCSFYAGSLYATATAYDTTYNTNIGVTNAVLTSTYGGYGYSGQLTFTLPVSAQSHSVEFSVSIYSTENGYYGGYYGGSLLAQTSSTFVIGPSYYEGYPTYPYSAPSYPYYQYYPSYPYYSGNWYYYSSSHPYYQYHPSYPGNGYYYSSNHPYYHNGGYYYYYHSGGNYYHNNNNNNQCNHGSCYHSHR